MSDLAVSVSAKHGQLLRKCLQSSDLYDSNRRSKSSKDGKVILPILDQGKCLEPIIRKAFTTENIADWEIVHVKLPSSKKNHIATPYQQMVSGIEKFLCDRGIVLAEEYRNDIPRQWERHGDLVMFGGYFQDPFWKQFGNEIWHLIAKILSCKKLALKGSVVSNGYRTPCVSLLLGENGYVEHVDNGIRYTYDVTKCMFSSGNVTEKIRIASFCCEGETVVDLYAGIGYFTLPYLVHSKARFVHACEWNPDAAEALKRNLSLNEVEDRCTIHFGDNREHCPKNIADRVNLGLIPSSEPGWEVACAALKIGSGGILHIHGNVESREVKINSPEICIGECSKGKTVHDFKDLDQNFPDTELNLCSYSSNGVPDGTFSEKSLKTATKNKWMDWSEEVSKSIKHILEKIHLPQQWRTNILHIEHVKSYAPHVDHLVLDLECRPI
ncbi:tRNA wybutosine-synthesizing protein 2 homolog [Saccostrea echinata]|uniref:tRNA wybutosine-synthesizing protein 2 homolog n=1 Tax=Saccostrea echinata TaxID=191078 RepID=UPI002A819032|nr:tRNA wybutosine-synthesizing protein 2 homolog [Saccostrea echinata]